MLRIEYDAVVAYHGYRLDEPWHIPGAVRLAVYDAVNGGALDRATTTDDVRDLERRLVDDALDAGIQAYTDNHHGFTVRVDSQGDDRETRHTYLHLRFSDGLVYVWLVPPGEHRPVATIAPERIVGVEGAELPQDELPEEFFVDDPPVRYRPPPCGPLAEGEVSYDDISADDDAPATGV